MKLKGRTVVLGVTGSIATYKMANVASMLVKKGADVHVIMTENATNFINPITFESLTNNKCLVETFDRNFQFHVAHVSLAKKADCMLIAPATANIIGKIAGGIADDMLSTTVMACKSPVIIAPAMNTNMYTNPIVQDNLKKLGEFGYIVIQPDSGRLACGDEGAGKLPKEQVLVDYIEREIAYEKDLKGKKVLVTAGPTVEAIDPVRFISNHSTGKMGYAIARAAMERGAEVTLISGPVHIETPPFVKVINVVSAAQMAEAVKNNFADSDIVIKSAAVADYRPAEIAENKIKKEDGKLNIELEKTEDILSFIGKEKRKGQIICGFSMETENLVENSRKKLVKKNLDIIIGNNLKTEGAGFGVDTNVVTMITKDKITELPLLTKDQVAHKILDAVTELEGEL